MLIFGCSNLLIWANDDPVTPGKFLDSTPIYYERFNFKFPLKLLALSPAISLRGAFSAGSLSI
jgi:hypothetical protein